MKRFYFKTFDHLKSFDILEGQEVIDLYLKNHRLLGEEGREKSGGDNEEPLFNHTHKIDEKAFWSGYAPSYYELETFKDNNVEGRKGMSYSKDAFAKADVISMDLSGLNETWTHFIYLELPNLLFTEYQTKVHSNPDVRIFKKFAKSVMKSDQFNDKDNVVRLAEKYDKLYPEFTIIENFFDKKKEMAWRADLEITQFLSIKNNGLIYPILYPQSHAIFGRGTHRALMHAILGFDVPIFMQVPTFPDKEKRWKVEMADMFSVPDVTFNINMEKKELSFFTKNELFLKVC